MKKSASIFVILVTFLIFSTSSHAAIPISLEEALSMAMENNEALLAVKNKISSASARVVQAKAARKIKLDLSSGATRFSNALSNEYNFPSSVTTPSVPVNASVNVLGVDIPFTFVVPPTAVSLPTPQIRLFSTSTSYDTKFNFVQPLYTGGRIEGVIFQAHKGKELAVLASKKATQETLYNVKRAYYATLKARALVNVAEDNVTQSKEHLKIAQAKLKAGKIPELDVMSTEIRVKEAYQHLTQAQNAYTLSLMTFNHLLGKDEEQYEPQDISEEQILTVPSENIILSDYLREAMTSRLEFQEADAALEMAKSGVKIAKAGKKPTLGLTGAYNFTGSTFFPPNESWSLSLGATWNLYDSGDTSAKAAEANLNVVDAKMRQSQLKKQITLEVKQAFFKMQEAQKAVRVLKDTLAQVEETYDITKLRYEKGLASGLEMIEADALLSRTKANYVQGVYDYFMTQAELMKAAGR